MIPVVYMSAVVVFACGIAASIRGTRLHRALQPTITAECSAVNPASWFASWAIASIAPLLHVHYAILYDWQTASIGHHPLYDRPYVLAANHLLLLSRTLLFTVVAAAASVVIYVVVNRTLLLRHYRERAEWSDKSEGTATDSHGCQE